MALPQHFLDELLARTDITELVSRYVPLKRKGGSMWGCCPFHHEKTPSFHVEQDKQFFKCFGCGEGGNAIHFLMKMENLPYIDAVRKLAENANMELPEEEDGGKGRLQRQRLLALNKDAARYYYDNLAGEKGREALQYLLNRGMTPQTIVRFGLGYAEDDWDSFISAMRKKGYTDLELETAKLAGRTKNGKLYPFFRGRVMFPIIDIRGDVVAFGGRVIKGDGDGRKYINSSDTPVYSKSRTLYAMNLAKKSKAGRFILCEGNIDVIALHQAGFDSAVASCGTAFTAEQARLLAKYTSEVVICYDADAAGLKATEKAIDILKQNGLNVRVQTGIDMPKIAEPYIRLKAMSHLEKGRVVIFACGTGNPFFSTDTAAALRAAEISAEAILLAKNIDGVYDSDPRTNPEAKKFDSISYKEVLSRGLAVMDTTATALAMDNNKPVLVFAISDPQNIKRVLMGENIGTVVEA